jgi:hypothetical protein
VNGVKVGSGDTWTTTYHFNPSVKPGDVIAIDGVDKGGPAAFIGVFDGKVTKASDWKCSLKAETGWNRNDFNDAAWAQAVSYGRNQDSNVWRSVSGGSRPNIPGDAEWIWTSNNENHDRVYCRYRGIPAQSAPVASQVAAKKTAPVDSSVAADEEKLKQLFKDSKDTHGFSREKLQKLKKNIQKLIADEKKNKEAELSEFQKTILFSDQDLAKLNKKYDEKVSGLLTLNSSITKLEQKIQQHYKQMLSDAKYLLLLDKIKPNYLKTLTSLNEHMQTIKDTIKINIVEGDDKALMLSIIYEMNDKNTNYTSVLSQEFINHYNRYKQKAGLEKAEYDKEYKELEILKTKYEAERRSRDSYLKEYENAKKILKQLQSNYDLDAEDIEAFKKLEEFIEKIFNNTNKC